ncbi:Fe-S cluster assembly ATPase SufC [Candidatus Gracilibacteria bacterium]|nr:Fe-S cluster assembly ATPase SufC [Candidatus Gracilibacteria bacterium]
MINIKNLEVSVGDESILKGVSLKFELGKNYCILGKNGSGKSTLSSVLMGHPSYEITTGEITLDGEDLIEMEPNERSAAGIFLSFQNIPEIKGVKLSEYLRTIFNIAEKGRNPDFKDISPFLFKRYIKKYLEELHIDEVFLERDLNVGFSGGEKRKIEILQMKLIGPKYIILDEIDSGLDLDAFKTVATMLRSLSSPENSIIIITHYFTILEYIDVDSVYVMKDGEVVKQGGKELAAEVQEKGFEKILN